MVMNSSTVAKQTSNPKVKPFRSVIGRTPQIRLHGDIITSPFAAKHAGTVIAAGKSITITKHGKPVARLVPPQAPEKEPFVPLLGLMKGKVKILGDIVSPDFEAWGMEDPRKTKKKKK